MTSILSSLAWGFHGSSIQETPTCWQFGCICCQASFVFFYVRNLSNKLPKAVSHCWSFVWLFERNLLGGAIFCKSQPGEPPKPWNHLVGHILYGTVAGGIRAGGNCPHSLGRGRLGHSPLWAGIDLPWLQVAAAMHTSGCWIHGLAMVGIIVQIDMEDLAQNVVDYMEGGSGNWDTISHGKWVLQRDLEMPIWCHSDEWDFLFSISAGSMATGSGAIDLNDEALWEWVEGDGEFHEKIPESECLPLPPSTQM